MQVIRGYRPDKRLSHDRVAAMVVAIGLHALMIGILVRSTPETEPLFHSFSSTESSGSSFLEIVDTSGGAAHVIEPIRVRTEPPDPSKPIQRADSYFTELAEQETERSTLAEPRTSTPSIASPVIDARPTSTADDSTALLSRYHAALVNTAGAHWETTSVPSGVHCSIKFVQIPGGEVVSIQYVNCPFDATARNSIERALHDDAMPYAGFESVFSREETIEFCYPSDACVANSPDSSAPVAATLAPRL
jgi:hypothetical protein